jgi:hypothetical protein
MPVLWNIKDLGKGTFRTPKTGWCANAIHPIPQPGAGEQRGTGTIFPKSCAIAEKMGRKRH